MIFHIFRNDNRCTISLNFPTVPVGGTEVAALDRAVALDPVALSNGVVDGIRMFEDQEMQDCLPSGYGSTGHQSGMNYC